MKQPKWIFTSNGGGLGDGPNHSSSDHFKESPLSSFVREIVQNSMDATDGSENPVKIIFKLTEMSKNSFKGFSDIFPHIESCLKEHKKDSLWHKRYKYMIDENKGKKTIPILCVHDANTTGLSGSISGETMEGSYYGLVKGKGLSNKNDTSGGSFGHGASSAFGYSKINTIFYYSKVNEKNPERFQGKSVLQSHTCPNQKFRTVGTGFYGLEKDGLPPLLDKEIPEWAKEFRNSNNVNFGTSVYIPYTNFTKDLFPETIISLIANFYIAFREGKLEAKVDDEIINSSNIEVQYKKYKEKFESRKEIDQIDETYIKECFKSTETIRNYSEKGTQQISNFGLIDWYIRIDDTVTWKKVGVSRSLGMLITRKPHDLKVFQGRKNFDLFVSVKGEKGNKTLKTLENPKHDNFELERLSDLDPKTKADFNNSYKNFVNKIKKIIEQYATPDTNEEFTIDIPELFGVLSDSGKNNENLERGNSVIITDGPLANDHSLGSTGGSKKGLGSSKSSFIKGKSKTKKTVFQVGKKISNVPANNSKKVSSKIILDNIRLTNLAKDGKSLTLFFDSPVSGEFEIVVYKKGTHLSEEIDFKNKKNITISILKDQRGKVALDFNDRVDSFILEACIYEII